MSWEDYIDDEEYVDEENDIYEGSVIEEFEKYCKEHGETPCLTAKKFLLLAIPGSLILVGPVLAFAKFHSAFSQFCRLYNQGYTEPRDNQYQALSYSTIHAEVYLFCNIPDRSNYRRSALLTAFQQILPED